MSADGRVSELSQALAAFLQRETGADAVRIDGLRLLTGGASRETWSFDAAIERSGATETLPVILQRDTRGAPKAITRALEFGVIRAAYDAGVPAPEPLFLGDATLGGEVMLVRRIDGETVPRRLLREDAYARARTAMPAQLGAAAAAIHGVEVDAPEFAALPGPPQEVSPAAALVQQYEDTYRTIALEPHPAFELAFRWLRAHMPADDRRTLVHGDFRIGNMLFGADGLRAVLDWELVHRGDPMEDLGFICVRSWRFGGPKPVGGIGERDEFFAAYEAAGGGRVDPQRVRFWEVFGNLKWGVICLSQARVYLDGRSKSLELAAIGRRAAETEWELLELVG